MTMALLDNFAFLLLCGLGVYVIALVFATRTLGPPRDAVTGVMFGMTVFLISSDAIVIPVLGAPLDMRAGPMIAAGFLGGPLGALVALAFASVARLLIGGPHVGLGLFFLAGFAAVGVVVARLVRKPDWPDYPNRAILFSAAGYALVQFLPVIAVPRLLGAARPDPLVGLSFAGIGLVSIALTGVLCRVAQAQVQKYQSIALLQNRLLLAATSAGIGVFEWHAGRDHVYFDQGMMALYGFDRPAGPMQTAEWRKGINPDDMGGVLQAGVLARDAIVKSGRFAFRYTRDDGQVRHIRANWVKEFGPDGQVERTVGIHADFTDIHLSQERQRRAEMRIAKVAESIPGVLMRLDFARDGAITIDFIGPQCQQIWGYSPAEIQADPLLLDAATGAEGQPGLVETLRELTRTAAPISARFRITASDQRVKWLELHGSVTDLSASLVHVDCVFVDVTTEVEAQTDLALQTALAQKAQKHESIGKLTGGVAHDFNNILAVIMGNLELLRDDLANDDQRSLVDNGVAAALRGAELTKNMLAFSRRAQLAPRISDLNRIVLDTKKWSERALPATIKIETSLLAGLWPVRVDTVSTESALLNLLINARDAMPDGGKLTIETANLRMDQDNLDTRLETLAAGRYVMLAVSDTGEGIAPAHIGVIFEPFFSTKGPGRGSGLGLSMIQGFMKQSGGAVRVCSELGTGTTFKLYFPAVLDKVAEAVEPVRNALPKGKGARILVAEDQADLLAAVMRTLQNDGHHVTAAGSGDLANDIFRDNPGFDLLLTDIVMPGRLQGTDLARALRADFPALKVVFMTGYAFEGAVHGNGLHPDDIRLMKPVLRADLLAAIRKALT